MGANIILKITFVVAQIVVIVFGVVLIAVGVWAEIQDQTFRDLVDKQEFVYGPYLLVAVGCAIMLVSAIGLVGALCETKINKFLLGFYIILVSLIVVAELAAAVIGFVYQAEAEQLINDTLNSTLPLYNNTVTANGTEPLNSITRAWDTVQEELECCGITGVMDWLNLASSRGETLNYPKSCCLNQTSSQCGQAIGVNQNNFFPQNCRTAVTDIVENNLIVVASIGISFIVGQGVLILLAFCLVCFSDYDD